MGINVLSLFDGISCGQIALERANIKVNTYYASEIDKFPIKVTQTNYPSTIQLGDVQNWREWDIDWDSIDLLIGGSPCQGFSSAGKLLNFSDPRSKLFFDYVDILNFLREKKDVKFLLENVNMKKEWVDIISEHLGVEPIFINSRLVSAQDRKRLYWTNIEGVELPKDMGISVQSIIGEGNFAASMRGRRIKDGKRADGDRSVPIVQQIECRMDDKTNCLSTVAKDNVVVAEKIPRTPASETAYRFYTPEEYEQLQTVPIGYTSTASDSRRREMLGNAWTVDVVSHIFGYFRRELLKKEFLKGHLVKFDQESFENEIKDGGDVSMMVNYYCNDNPHICWQDPVAVGINGMSLQDVREEIVRTIDRLANLLYTGSRVSKEIENGSFGNSTTYYVYCRDTKEEINLIIDLEKGNYETHT